jgi:lipoate-protein ligase A
VRRKYGAWSWNYGQDPACNVQRARRFPAGELDARLDIQHGRIAGVRIFGDFMGREEVGALEARLVGLPYERSAVVGALEGVDVSAYFGDVSRDDVVEVLCP